MAAGTFGLAAVVLLGTVGVARASAPQPAARGPNPARQLEALMRAGELGSWSVTYEFTRTLADGRVLREPEQEARDPSIHVLRSGSTMTVDKGAHSYDCNLTGTQFACTESATGTTLAPSDVLTVAVAAGAYDVTAASTIVIAAAPARCFRVLATGHGQLPDLGLETDMCFSSSGVPLLQRVIRASGDVDERIAQSVATPVTTRTIEATVEGLDPNRAARPQ
jgi:hypothetical protein